MSGEKTILVIEDDLDMQRLLNRRLRAASYRPVFASDAVSSISVARRESPDLILLDLGLPGGGGLCVLERLRKNMDLVHVPVAIYSAREEPEAGRRALAAGASAFLSKSVSNEKLMDTIGQLLTA